MNLISFLLYWGYVILNSCCCKLLTSEEYDVYEKCSDEMQKQLDIAYLVKRINTLERVVVEGSASQELKFRRVKFKEA